MHNLRDREINRDLVGGECNGKIQYSRRIIFVQAY
jgi:hypothetical protein